MTPEGANNKLLQAAKAGNVTEAQAALAAGAEVNARDRWQQTPLHFAVRNGNADVARLLIEKGVEINATTNEQRPPLHWAVINGHSELAGLLIEKGADPNARDARQQTPLHWAVENGDTELADFIATAWRWHRYVEPLLGADQKLDATQLVDQAGQPAQALKHLLANDLFGNLARPDFYRQGMDGLVLVFPHLPEAVQASIDLTPWRRARVVEVNAATSPEERIERYVRTRRAPSSEVGR
jgi:hypothetical protein